MKFQLAHPDMLSNSSIKYNILQHVFVLFRVMIEYMSADVDPCWNFFLFFNMPKI